MWSVSNRISECNILENTEILHQEKEIISKTAQNEKKRLAQLSKNAYWIL